MTKSEEFVTHMINRCQIDGRLALLVGPSSEAYDLMVGSYAEIQGLDVEKFKKQYAKTLKTCREWQRI